MTDEIVLDLTKLDEDEDKTLQYLSDLIAYWESRDYVETSAGVYGESFTDINTRYAEAKVAYYERLLAWLEDGKYLRIETKAKIKTDWKRKCLT